MFGSFKASLKTKREYFELDAANPMYFLVMSLKTKSQEKRTNESADICVMKEMRAVSTTRWVCYSLRLRGAEPVTQSAKNVGLASVRRRLCQIQQKAA